MPRRQKSKESEGVLDLIQLEEKYDELENVINASRDDIDQEIDLDESMKGMIGDNTDGDEVNEDKISLSDLSEHEYETEENVVQMGQEEYFGDQDGDDDEDVFDDHDAQVRQATKLKSIKAPGKVTKATARSTKQAPKSTTRSVPRTSTPMESSALESSSSAIDSDHWDEDVDPVLFETDESESESSVVSGDEQYDEEPGPSKQKRPRSVVSLKSAKPIPRRRAKSVTNITWTRKAFHQPDSSFTGTVDDEMMSKDVRAPIEYFSEFINNDVINLIATRTRNYYERRQKEANVSRTASTAPSDSSFHRISKAKQTAHSIGGPIDVNEQDIRTLLGILLAMGLQPLDDTLKYWSSNYRNNLIANAMSQNRFRGLMRNLHFVDNDAVNEITKADRVWEIRPLIEKIRRGFLAVTPDEHQSVDEQMIAYKGHHGMRQFMKGKPIRYGFKVFARASPDGFVHDFELYQGKASEAEADEAASKGVNLSEYAVVKMLRDLPQQCGYKIYADRWFSGVRLAEFILDRGDHFTGTVVCNRLAGGADKLISFKELKKKGRGSFDEVTTSDGRICLVRWVDSACVHMVSTLYGTEPLDMAKRSFKNKDGTSEKRDVPRPHMIKQYNTKMGGVDLSNMFRAKYSKSIKSRHWYMYIFQYLINLATRNAWVLYRREFKRFWNGRLVEPKPLRLFEFIQEIATTLCSEVTATRNASADTISAAAASDRSDSLRYDRMDHWPVTVDQRRRCPVCTEKGMRSETTMLCSKCNVALCIAKGKTCFMDYHTK